MLMVLAEGFYFLTIESDSCVPILGSCLWMSMSSGALFPTAYLSFFAWMLPGFCASCLREAFATATSDLVARALFKFRGIWKVQPCAD